jgi:hypothetical protein
MILSLNHIIQTYLLEKNCNHLHFKNLRFQKSGCVNLTMPKKARMSFRYIGVILNKIVGEKKTEGLKEQEEDNISQRITKNNNYL